MTVVAFDFDGTITKKDTFIEFIKFTKGTWFLLFGFLYYSPYLIAYKLRLYPNWKIKQLLFKFYYKGTSLDEFNNWGRSFSHVIEKFVRSKAIEAIKSHLDEGSEVIIVSASIENWIKPWASVNGINSVAATQLEIDNNELLTGRFLSYNCYGKEKVNRILEMFPNREQYHLQAYGDSQGDKELLEFADKGHFKVF